MGLGGSITPNVQQSASDAETLGERDVFSQAFIRSTALRQNS